MYRSEWPEFDTFPAIDGCEGTTLSAALALVDDEDFDCFAQTPCEPVSTPSSADSTNSACSASEDNEENEDTTRKSIAQPRKRRPTRRNQIQLLHATARQLEARLVILHERAANGQLARVTKARRSSRKMNQMWKHIATNQIKALSESERKNARLRAAVEDQLRLIKGLERFISKRQSKTLSWCPYYFRHSIISVNPFDDPQVDREMHGCIEEMLLDVDRILADERLQGHSDEPVSMTEVTSDELDHQVVEAIQARMFPFAHLAVANAQMTMWTSEHVHMMHNVRRKDIHVDGDIVRGVLEGEFQLRNMTVVFLAKMIGRRVIQDGRIIMPAVVLIEPAIKQDKVPLGRVYLRSRIWNIFSSTPGDELTTSRVYYSSCSPVTFGGDEGKNCSEIATLGSLVLQVSRVRMNISNQILENLMLENFAQAVELKKRR